MTEVTSNAFRSYMHGLTLLKELIRSLSEEEADKLRETMDMLWKQMSTEERNIILSGKEHNA